MARRDGNDMNPVEFCRDTAAPPGSNLHYATLFHPAGERRGLNALFALRAEVMRIAAGTPDPAVIAMRRSWWTDELARVGARQARHPVGHELQLLTERTPIDIAALQYFAATGGDAGTGAGIWAGAARACGVSEPDAVRVVTEAGELVDRVDSIAGTGPVDAAVQPDVVRDLAARLESASGSLASRGAAPAEFCRILVGLSAALCTELARDVEVIGRSRIALTPLRKLWIAWRIHRRGVGI
ncbi:MAG TPA: squalene/phytoene synthase family protein [Gammaproteobacteria bacterium]